METDSRKGASREADAASWNLSLVCVLCSPGGRPARSPPSGSQGLLEEMLAASGSRAAARSESAASGLRGLSEEEGATAGADRGEDSLPSWRPQPDGVEPPKSIFSMNTVREFVARGSANQLLEDINISKVPQFSPSPPALLSFSHSSVPARQGHQWLPCSQIHSQFSILFLLDLLTVFNTTDHSLLP